MSPSFLKKPVSHIANSIYKSDTEECIGFIVYCVDSQKAGERLFYIELFIYIFIYIFSFSIRCLSLKNWLHS